MRYLKWENSETENGNLQTVQRKTKKKIFNEYRVSLEQTIKVLEINDEHGCTTK